jgi:hypothetical protein
MTQNLVLACNWPNYTWDNILEYYLNNLLWLKQGFLGHTSWENYPSLSGNHCRWWRKITYFWCCVQQCLSCPPQEVVPLCNIQHAKETAQSSFPLSQPKSHHPRTQDTTCIYPSWRLLSALSTPIKRETLTEVFHSLKRKSHHGMILRWLPCSFITLNSHRSNCRFWKPQNVNALAQGIGTGQLSPRAHLCTPPLLAF